VRGKLLMPNASAAGKFCWHGLGDISGMIPLLLIFFAIGTLMCGLIAFDPAGHEPAPVRLHRRSKKNSHRATSKVELRPDPEVESSHTARGSAHGQ